MQSHFGDDIVFHQQFDKKKPELVFSSKISLQDVTNSAALELHTSNKQVISDEANARNCIFEAAKTIKHEIKECNGISTRPLDVSDLNEDIVKRLVPNDLYWLLRWIIGLTLDIEDTSTIDEKKGCDRFDIVFDQYRDMSIKSHERSRRGSSSALESKDK